MYYFRSNTLVYWFSESLSVPTYRATVEHAFSSVNYFIFNDFMTTIFLELLTMIKFDTFTLFIIIIPSSLIHPSFFLSI